MFNLHYTFSLGMVFSLETKENWALVLHSSCSCNCELDVRILNHLNWTSTA